MLGTVDRTLAVIDDVARSSLAREVADRVMASGLAQEALQTLTDRVLESPEVERLAGRLVDSRAADAAMHHLLRTTALWDIVDEIAQSAAVTTAISQQSIGVMGEVAGTVRRGSQTVDERVERLAQRLVRRRAHLA